MCGRYVSPDDASIEREFGLIHQEWQFPANFNTAPTQLVPVIRRREGALEGVLLRWGLVPYFAKGQPGKNPMFNARAETVAANACFSGPWKYGRRCIIPAIGFYEWHVNPDGSKQPYYIHVDDQSVFGFAGLWERSRVDAKAAIESCSIITLPANALMAGVHNSKSRMPAILTRETREDWLSGSVDAAAAALAPYEDNRMIAYPVSRRVNAARENDESLVEPLRTDVD